MKSKEAYDTILSRVNTKYGSPMGRFSDDLKDRPTNVRVFDRRVPLCSGAYDRGGAYWGFPSNLRVEYSADLSYKRFYRT